MRSRTMQRDAVEQIPLLDRAIECLEVRQEKDGEAEVTRLTFAASSETPVERYFGDEVLSHEKAAVRLDRVSRGAMPLLFNHDFRSPIGLVDGARIEKDRLVVDAHLFDTAQAREVGQMLRGGLRNVSIGYRLYRVEEDKKTGVFTARDWEPYEVSIVSVPADPTVGIGRSIEEKFEVRILRASQPADTAIQRSRAMPKGKDEVQGGAAEAVAEEQERREQERRDMEERERRARAELEQQSAQKIEAGRVHAIDTLVKANKLGAELRQHWVTTGATLEQVSEDILRILEERGKSDPKPASALGLSSGDQKRYSLTRAIQACASGNWSGAEFEAECSRTVQDKLQRVPDPKRFFVPFEILQRPVDEQARELFARMKGERYARDLTVASAGAGGYLVATDNVGFIEILRNRSVAFRMGARRLSGLVGNVTVPRQSAAATAVWLANEASTATESQQTFVQMALSPKSVGAYTEISRQLLLQSSPAAEGVVSQDLASVVAVAADLAVLEGSGSAGQPTGISATSGIGSVTGTSLGYAGVLEFQTDVAAANVMPARGGYVTTPAVAALMMQRVKFTSTASPLWEGNVWDGSMAGFPAMSSNQPTAASMVFGDWNEVIVGEWGVLEVEVNPFANFQAGIIGVRAIYSLDVGVRRPFAFSRSTSIT